ncbi:MAG TPA: SNF2-related protein [Ilumatobacteraceae bacterium]|nr:SNF2-related protein [Ilumatobacteraceae bacterium]
MLDSQQLITAIWSISEGHGSDDELALLRADQRASLSMLDRLINETEADLEVVRNLEGDERDQVVADFTDTLHGLRATAARLRGQPIPAPPVAELEELYAATADHEEPAEVQLQASWSAGQIVVWAGARGADPETNDQLATRLEAIGGPAVGWQLHRGVPLPGGKRAEAVSIPMKDALGWLVAIGGGEPPPGVGASVTWLGRVALEGVRLAARGAIVPTVRVVGQPKGGHVESVVRWVPALLDRSVVDALANTMPGAVVAAGGGDGRVTATAVITAAVEAIVSESIERMDLPAAPANATTPVDVDHTVMARLDGTPFKAHAGLATAVSRRFDHWNRSVKDPGRPKLIVQLDPPRPGGVWLVSVFVPSGKTIVPLDAAMRTDAGRRTISGEWQRLVRLVPALDRTGTPRRGQVALSQDEAWKFMTVVGPTLVASGFEARLPEISRKKAKASLRLFAEAPAGSVVGARQLSNVTWSVLFDDAELTADDIKRLARQARPLVESHGRWVEVDRFDIERAAAALAERESVKQLTGAEILRHSFGLGDAGLSGGVVVHGNSWANEIVQRAGEVKPITEPVGFSGTLRTYQAEAVAWIGFLEAADLGGCLALDMGLGKTPTVLAHLARSEAEGSTLVIAPAAVVGNWAAEAARFTPDVRVVVHHGASRASADELAAEIAGADIVITTYATAVRDIDALVTTNWHTVVLDEAQAIKNPASDTAQQLRRLRAHTRLALTGTPIENGLGDLWAILDFTNPGLVGSRASFLAQMSGDGEAALRALNGLLLFRRTKVEPEVAAELPDKIDELDHCTMTPEQIGLYQAVLDDLLQHMADEDVLAENKKGAILAAITALKQICNHPAAYRDDAQPLAGRSGKLARLEEIVESVFAAGERILIFTHFATWGRRLAEYLTEVTGLPIACYDGSLARGVRDRLVSEFQSNTGPGAMVLSLKAGGTGLNLTAANHVVLYDRWWNPAVEDQARDRAWRIGQGRTVISHRLVCPGTIDERVEEVVAGKRHIANLVLPRSSSLSDLNADQLRLALGLRPEELLSGDGS